MANNDLSSPLLTSSQLSGSSWHDPPHAAPVPRPRPAPLRSVTGVGQGSSSAMHSPRGRHRRAASSSSVLHLMTSPSLNRPTSPPSTVQPSSPLTPMASPRFSQLLTSVLGSPFVTTMDLQPSPGSPEAANGEAYRASSPVPSVDYSVIDIDPDDPHAQFATNPSIPGGFPVRRSRHWHGHARSFSTSIASMNLSRSYAQDLSSDVTFGDSDPSRASTSLQSTFKSLLPRIWDAISSPGRVSLAANASSSSLPSDPSSRSSSRTASPSPTRPSTPLSRSWIHAHSDPEVNRRTHATFWNNRNKGKARTTGFFSRSSSQSEYNEHVSFSDLDPLDDDEGELIDDEGCFIDVRAITGIDILALLPPELALHILLLLSPSPPDSTSGPSSKPRSALSPIAEQEEALHALLACRAVSHTWRRLASDNAVWRALFISRWSIDLDRATPEALMQHAVRNPSHKPLGPTWDFDWGDDHPRLWESRSILPKGKQPAPRGRSRDGLRDRSIFLCPRRISYITTLSTSPLQLDWRVLYRERLELDRRWMGTAPTPSPHSSYLESLDGYDLSESKENIKPFEPAIRRLKGHTDSVYCLEFDSQRIMTGSRDRTIKIWSLKTGQLLGTFRGVHRGSVLCLKFERDWDRIERGSEGNARRTGMLVSGSSDCTVCVWDLEVGGYLKGSIDTEVFADVRTTLRGHDGGVLDLRMDDKWIVSCSKDASIRVWDRNTLDCVRTLRGHDGPVNAIGLQKDKIVSASGDGKMILWDITSGERIRTFEGHDRGLACIEFKDNLIVSGSNDCKIKVWDPWTGECIRTLAGHEALVRALCFDPRTARLVSVSYDRTVKVWDLRSGKLVREFKKIHTSHIFDVKFDVSRIVTTSHDHQIIELDFSGGLDASLFI